MPTLTVPKQKEHPTSLLSNLMDASRKSGRSLSAIAFELIRIRIGKHQLGLSEYFDYNLFNEDQSLAEKLEFIGWRTWGSLERRCIPPQWWATFEDKLTLYATLGGLEIPIPKLHAIYQRGRSFKSVISLSTNDELQTYLRKGAAYPLFAKPNATGHGVGISMLTGFDNQTDELITGAGGRAKVEAVCDEIDQYFDGGYLFQEVMTQSAQLTDLIGRTIGTIRLMTAATIEGPRLYSAAWRIPAGRSVVDNYSQHGNFFAGIDIESGIVTRVARGTGLSQVILTHHPDTGAKLVNVSIPYWDEITRLGLSCTAAFPGIGLQGWDIAITENGPVVIEANIAGDGDFPQVANQIGIGNQEFVEILKLVKST